MNLKWLEIVKMIAPIIISSTVPHGDLIAPLVYNGITEAETLQNVKSVDKLVHARTVVNLGISGINAAAGMQKVDPVAVNQVLDEGISTVVDVANLIHSKSITPN